MLFDALKNVAGTPQRLVSFHDAHQDLRQAAHNLENWLTRTDFERRVFSSKKLFPQVPMGFEEKWKEYRRDWALALSHLMMRDIWPEGFGVFDTTIRGRATTEFELEEPDPEFDSEFSPLYHDGAAALNIGIEMWDLELERREDNLKSTYATDDDERIANGWRIAKGAYDYLTQTISIEPKEIFRRWRSVPVFFMPAHVANKHGDEKGSLNDLLSDAIRAYVAGAPAAAIAMCRAALELVLKELYLPDDHTETNKKGELWDKPLGKLIVLAEKRYDHLNKGELKPLAEKANEIVHRYSRRERLSAEDERTFIDFLTTVKTLIDRAQAPT
jgi:hypothetical protein